MIYKTSSAGKNIAGSLLGVRSAIILIVVASLGSSAHARSSAISAELAQMCRHEAIAAHPTPRPGTPNQGIKQAQRTFFQACVANYRKQ